ncbi:restriction endonuclease subunit S [Thermoactinomyces sp. CICC 10735]|jgi:type I restriction enzyme, S subunit|uniref:restriction endonuclease subunit S n=1 Tax=Thermoactinomyces sp. CICC 10735 TaxID=2767430 RepID=UPI0018DDC82A|nr:restriction endonuclease subunit S [Thermoactinomyces sp. CICC 10735]MBH8583880.1 restriction endonuclease subunit S [Thermoactinomyces sp. CICC 10735]
MSFEKDVIKTKLGDLIEIKHGFAFKGKYFSEEETELILLTPGNFKIGGGFSGDKYKFYQNINNFPEEYILDPGDLLITMTDLSKNGDTLGYPAIVPQIPSKKLLHNQRLGKVSVKDKRLDKDFLYYLLCSNKYRHHILATATGSTVKHTSPKRILDFEFYLPSLEKQRKIASILSSLDRKIELNNQINKNLEEMAQAIFKSWFVDFEPFQDGEFAESELGLIPKGWSINTIQELSKEDGIICGKTPSTKIKENYGDYMPFITIPDMHGKVFVSRTERMLSKKGVESQPKKTLPPNSINVSCIATPGLVTITSEPSQTNQQINSVICKDNISYLFMYLSLSNLSDHIRNLGSGGSTTLNLNKTEFSKIKLIVPDQQVMDNFHSLVEPIFNSILKNQKEIELLQDLRDTLLPKLMSGEIRVPLENEGRQQDEQLQRV